MKTTALLVKGIKLLGNLFCILGFSVAASTSAIATGTYILPESVTVLSEEQLLDRIVGNTALNLGYDGGRGYIEYYEPPTDDPKKGMIRGMWRKTKYSGTWKVEGNWFCFHYDGAYLAHWNRCYSIKMEGARITMYHEDGSTFYPYGGPLRMVSGNPGNF